MRRIYCVGRNYVDHIREMKEATERDPPFFFQKPADALVRHGGTVPYPPATTDLQYEVELVLAIGREGADVAPEEALGFVYGYAVGIDMTRRDLQRACREQRLPWEAGKSFDHSAPCSEIVTSDHVGHPAGGELSLDVNGVRRQHGNFGQMIWTVPEIVSRLSCQYRLQPGDLVFTGTPAGVGAVQRGDVLHAAIAGIGELSVSIS
ncbi:MAG TPA: fumarylacetoacetate hydrolase family protein [Ramlibacter sp.]|nr:fumarylacetoacetate hydrolase family protein [Ramlibacter sp.]